MAKFQSLIATHVRPRKVIFQHSWPQKNTVLVPELNVDRQRSQGPCERQRKAGKKRVQVPSSGPLGLPSLPHLQLLPLLHFKHRGFLLSVPDQAAAMPLNKYAVTPPVRNL